MEHVSKNLVGMSEPKQSPAFVQMPLSSYNRMVSDLREYNQKLDFYTTKCNDIVKITMVNEKWGGQVKSVEFTSKDDATQRVIEQLKKAVENHEEINKNGKKLLSETKEMQLLLDKIKSLDTFWGRFRYIVFGKLN